MNAGIERYRERLLDAMAELLVRLHLAGFYWGDCSLSNTLFRRDAGRAPGLPGRRRDLGVPRRPVATASASRTSIIMEENVAGRARRPRPHGSSCRTSLVRARYRRQRSATATSGCGARSRARRSIAPSESYRIHERIRALNDLGFSVGEIELVSTGQGDQLRHAHDRHRPRLSPAPAAQPHRARRRRPPGGADAERDPRAARDAVARAASAACP